ncbi:MATE family efflux transporter [Clostridium sp. MSJ-4]|uniref:Probable multidrug resistance protein NorM n=1 Tax=Clostridium simiarum TaxID=2841506 RepID=A0ABS6EYT6_9CLOT|nr:MATE family efflux transporter [Clostridium simiarum]MBU5591392.1 MATE family efflux transporter [Clostridium simiarum]
MTTDTNDLLTGDLKRNLLKMSIPTMLGFLLQSVYDIVDIIWIGRISSSAVAGVTLFSTIFWMVDILNEIIGTSSISLISQSYGSKDQNKTSLAIEQTLIFKALVAVIAAIIMLLTIKPLLNIFSKDTNVIQSALQYGYIRIFFLPIMFSSYTVNTALRCLGDAKTPMKIMIVSSILNVVLDPIFMFETIPGTSIPGLNLGVLGAGIATVISTVVAFIIGFYILISGKGKIKIKIKNIFKLDLEIDKKLLTIGLPSGVEMLFRQFSGMITIYFVSDYGTNALAAIGIGNKLFNFAFMPLLGFAIGSSSIVGQCLGAENISRAKETVKYSTLINISLMCLLTIMAFLFPSFIMKSFIKDPAVIDIGIPMIKIMTPALIASGVSMGLGSVFSGSGHNTPFMLSSLISRWGVQIPLIAIMVRVLKLPMNYIWSTFLIANIVEVIVVYVFYKKGTWEHKRV